MTINLNSQITRYGVSESFNTFIDGLRETPGLVDKKFRLADVNKMAQYLVCRNYRKACLELSYLLWAVVNYPADSTANHSPHYSPHYSPSSAPLLEFFWLNESITPARFRQAFKTPYKNNNIAIALNGAGLNLTLSKQSFVISPTRVGLLAVLFEIIISLTPDKLALIEQTLQGNDDGEKAIKKLSSDLQKQLYQFLAEHLVPAQQQRRFRYISQWLALKNTHDTRRITSTSHTTNKSSASTNLLTDETILFFWQYAAQDESSPGYKLYASAFTDIIETHQAIQQAKQALALDNANTIGFNVEGGEYSPDIIESLLFDEASTIEDYAWLCNTPKFLTKSQWRFIEPLIQKQSYVKNLPLSFARLAIFGQWQASIVQAKRKSPVILQEKLNELPEQNYLIYQQQLVKQTKVVVQVILTLAHIFYRHQDSRYLGCILAFLSKATTTQIKNTVSETMRTSSQTEHAPLATLDSTTNKMNKALFTQSQIVLKDSLEYNRIMQTAKTAFNGNNKDGFQHLPDIETLDTYQDGYDALTQCQHIIQTYLAQCSKTWLTSEDCQLNYCSDVSIFKDMFDQLYGEVDDQ